MRKYTLVHKNVCAYDVSVARSYIASRKEVAELAGVSEATVSRVLNNVVPVKEETKQRLKSAALNLGYTPSSLAQSFARSRSGNLGVVMPYLPKAA